jgi:hypothetical protein
MTNNDETDTILSFCSDLVTQKRFESFPTYVLSEGKIGEWLLVRLVCLKCGISNCDSFPELVVTWLPEPSEDPDYAVIIFFEPTSLQSLPALYNKTRLLGVKGKVDAES